MARHESVWITTSQQAGFGAPQGAVDVDVAVVGAGIAGLTTALLLKQSGLRVAVLEAGAVCSATTGHTTAKVSTRHGLIYDALSSSFGIDGARAYAQANLAALGLIEELVREHEIDCDWERRAAYAYTEDDSHVAQIEQEVEAAREAGCRRATPSRPICRGPSRRPCASTTGRSFIRAGTAWRSRVSSTETAATSSSRRAHSTSRRA